MMTITMRMNGIAGDFELLEMPDHNMLSIEHKSAYPVQTCILDPYYIITNLEVFQAMPFLNMRSPIFTFEARREIALHLVQGYIRVAVNIQATVGHDVRR
jgi:hypothetical protein